MLSELIGKEILVGTRFQNANSLSMTAMTLLEIENGGIWVESYSFTQEVLRAVELPTGKTPRLFFPFSSVAVILIGADEKIALSEKSFGV